MMWWWMRGWRMVITSVRKNILTAKLRPSVTSGKNGFYLLELT
jgi:hypothetical protein